jgi:hypothetical protein
VFFTVTEVRSWGVICATESEKGIAPYPCGFDAVDGYAPGVAERFTKEAASPPLHALNSPVISSDTSDAIPALQKSFIAIVVSRARSRLPTRETDTDTGVHLSAANLSRAGPEGPEKENR